ncbi:MAG: hypothetical protein IJ390_01920 [Lachnospiraceae bacterium]|nr:hypothetical protein [Lachnospiraceae bacterium]
MNDKKKDLIPIAAIAIFLVIIIILCVVRLQQRNGGREDESSMSVTESIETTETAESIEMVSEEEKETETVTDTKDTALQEKTEKETAENEIPSGKDKSDNPTVAGRTISGNDPLAAAEGVNKTNEEMLMEMAGYWEQNNMDAVEDLANLAWFMKMSASIADQDTFYYYGERNDQGQPEGYGIACYADNAYYYGQWVNGKRQGQGEWVKYYVYYDDDTTSDRAYRLHMYMGEWANDMPNGEGQEHYDLDMSQASNKTRYLQNMIGTFKDGLYSGEMYLTTLNWDGNQEEWNGVAEEGIWSPYGAATNKKEIPICRDVDDDDNYLWIMVSKNKERGIGELMP